PAVKVDRGTVAVLRLSDQGAPQFLRIDDGREVNPTATPEPTTLVAHPSGVSVAEGLTVARVTLFRRIRNFKEDEVGGITKAKISADGVTIIFSTYQGTYVMGADGKNLTRL